MRAWRCRQGFVIERGPSARSLPAALWQTLPDWARRRPPADHLLIDAHGEVLATLTVSVWDLEDELGASLCAIDGASLHQLLVRERWGRSLAVEEDAIVADDLSALARDDEAALAVVRAACGRFREMAAIAPTRLSIGLAAEAIDPLALALARADEAAHEPGLGGFDVFDLDGAVARYRSLFAASAPAREVELGAFAIDLHPVTNAEWALFAPDTRIAPGTDDDAVTRISWERALEYARWCDCDLPTEAEWECAARTPGSGVREMRSHNSEYCRDELDGSGQRVMRGGFGDTEASAVARQGVQPNVPRAYVTFRCVRRPTAADCRRGAE